MQETEEAKSLIPGLGDPLEEDMQPTAVFLPGKSHGQRTWRVTGYGVAESDMTEVT